jgi:hypothetical protein
MVWSISTAKMFDRCQRQWFYKRHYASALAKDGTRRKAYLLGKLQSVSAWRGSLVDRILSVEVLPAIGRGEAVSQDYALSVATDLFDRQLATAQRHRIHEPGFRPSDLDDDFAAFYDMEYGGGIKPEEIEQAREEVEKAITGFFGNERLMKRLAAASRLIVQRRLVFDHSDTKVGAVPDLIVFPRSGAPAIVDWKVHTFAFRDALLQMTIYAAALVRNHATSGFPIDPRTFGAPDIGLLEVQLLTGKLRKHVISDEDLVDADSYIAGSAEAMLLTVGETVRKASTLSPLDFPAARYPATCETCAYRSLCWETSQ